MAKKDLYILAKKAKRILELDQNLRRKYFNKKPHIFTVDKRDILEQTFIQLGLDKAKVSEDDMKAIEASVNKYVEALRGRFKFSSSKDFTYVVTDYKAGFRVLVTSTSGKDVYDKIYRIRTERGTGPLKALIEEIRQRFGANEEVLNNIRNLTDIGHERGSSVAEKTIQIALNRFGPRIPDKLTPEEVALITPVYNIVLSTPRLPGGSKSFIVKVSEEASVANQAKGRTDEKQLIQDARAAINKFIDEVDWFNQEGSNSVNQQILLELLATASKVGGKVKTRVKKKTNTSQDAAEKIKASYSKPVKLKPDIPKTDKVRLAEESRSTNWLQLLPLINVKLPPQVMKNMGSPRLNNRTGRLAQSAQVVNVEQTREGFPSFVFNYERDPYDVFDRTLGRAPWNTPQRDPRALVDQSVREIVREMAIGRFFTRRA